MHFYLSVSRWVAKKHVHLTGPPFEKELKGDEAFRVAAASVKEKWGIDLIRHDISQIHKVAHDSVIISFNDLKVGSAFWKLLNANKRDYNPG